MKKVLFIIISMIATVVNVSCINKGQDYRDEERIRLFDEKSENFDIEEKATDMSEFFKKKEEGNSEFSAQVYTYRTTEYAYQQTDSNGNWKEWSDWEESNMLVTINFSTDIVNIYSSKTQTYYIKEHIRSYTDSSGGKQIEFAFIDQDNDWGHMRLRIEVNGNSQIYIDFNNIRWCYNVTRTTNDIDKSENLLAT